MTNLARQKSPGKPQPAPADTPKIKLPARGVPVVYLRDHEVILHPAWKEMTSFTADERREVIARSQYRLAHPRRGEDEAKTLARINGYWRERAECRVPIEDRPPGARLCWHPKECVYGDHAWRFAWRGSGCIPGWMELLVSEVCRKNPRARVYRLRLETGQLPEEDAADLHSMVLLAKRFSRAGGFSFQWSDWLTRWTGVLPKDRNQYHLEARICFKPPSENLVTCAHKGSEALNKAMCVGDERSTPPPARVFGRLEGHF